MQKKNRFSILLEQTMLTADLKNYTLAQELRYDVSYISKWTSGKMLPSSKVADKVFHCITKCVMESLTEQSRLNFYLEYQVETDSELERLLYNNFKTTYNYVVNLKKSTGSEIAPDTFHYPDMSVTQFIQRMHPPVLKRFDSYDIIAALDIFSFIPDYQRMLTHLDGVTLPVTHFFPNAHFSTVVNIDIGEKNYYNMVLLFVNMLTNLSHIDFKLYGNPQAYGRLVFTAKDLYCVAGMTFDSEHCLSVTTSEDTAICNSFYDKLKFLCNRESLLFYPTTIYDLIRNYNYRHTLISTNLKWFIGNITEHIVPDSIFLEAMQKLLLKDNPNYTVEYLEEVHMTHRITMTSLAKSSLQVILKESALSDFTMSGKLDFYNHPITLSPAERLECMRFLRSCILDNENLEIRILRKDFASDFPYFASPCMFLSGEFSYLRLDNKAFKNNLSALNGHGIHDIFYHFYDIVWNHESDIVCSDKDGIIELIDHHTESLILLCDI